MLTGVAVRFCGEACKRFGGTVALWQWGWECRRTRGGVAWPQDMEHDAQPHQGDQHSLGEKERGDHGKTPSYRWRNEGILETIASLPGFNMAPEEPLSYP